MMQLCSDRCSVLKKSVAACENEQPVTIILRAYMYVSLWGNISSTQFLSQISNIFQAEDEWGAQ